MKALQLDWTLSYYLRKNLIFILTGNNNAFLNKGGDVLRTISTISDEYKETRNMIKQEGGERETGVGMKG